MNVGLYNRMCDKRETDRRSSVVKETFHQRLQSSKTKDTELKHVARLTDAAHFTQKHANSLASMISIVGLVVDTSPVGKREG